MAQQNSADAIDTRDVSIYPQSKRVKCENQFSFDDAIPSAPSSDVVFPDISKKTFNMFYYYIQTFPELKTLYDSYTLSMVLECINIQPDIWFTFTIEQQKFYLDIYVKTQETRV